MTVYNPGHHTEIDPVSEHVRLFNLVIGVGVERAHEICESTGHNLPRLKAQCRSAGEELIATRGHLLSQEQSVFNWSKL
jgi:hypothetical protein